MMKNKYLRILLCMLLSVALLLAMGATVAAEESTETEEEIVEEEAGEEEYVAEYEQLAQSGDLTLNADLKTGHFYIENTATGKKWHSIPEDLEQDEVSKGASTRGTVRSELIVSYVNFAEMATVEYAQEAYSATDCIDDSGESAITVKKIENGMRVEYVFPAIGITVPVEYTLKDGNFDASVMVKEIVDDQIVEENQYILVDVTVLPAFGAGNWAAEGYLFVPDGCGALIGFNNGIQLSSNYKSMVYGSDMSIIAETQVTYTEAIRLPVFGTVVGDEALMGIITVGDGASSITAINGHDRCGYNAVSSVFHYRVMQAQYNLFNKRKVNLVARPEYKYDTYSVRYTALSGEDADYVGMANEYRQYLIDEKGLAKQNINPTFHLNAVGAFEQPATFLGIIPYTERVKLTSFEDCQKMLEALKGKGIEDVTLKYIGWSNNGIENAKLPKAANSLGVLGGNKKLAVLQEYVKGQNIELYPEADLMTFQKNGNGVSINKNAVRSVFGKTTYRYKYMLSTYVSELGTDKTVLLSPEKLVDIGGRYLTSLKKQNFSAVSLSTMGEYCYSNFYEKNGQYRAQFPEYVENTLQPYKDAGVKMSFSGGNAYVLPYASMITDVPMNSSGYDIFAEDVPFYQAVLHGYIPYTTKSLPQTADPEAGYLAAVETGTELAYAGIYEDASVLFDTAYDNLYGSNYELWIDKAAGQHAAYAPLQENVKNETIADHSQPVADVYVTEYSNGTKVYVNYNQKAVTVDGVEIDPRSFEYVIAEEVTVNE